jgi:RNA polymerase sigma factor (sigma-70 family)
VTDILHIIEGCKNGDRLSQEKLYKQFYPALYALCRSFFDEKHEILTAINNGMLRVYKNIDQFDSSKASLFTWIYTIVRNASLSMLKERRKETPMVYKEDLEAHSFIQPIFSGELNETYMLLYKLPPTTRAVCSLFYVEGFSIKEIAESMDLKEGTVKWHLNEGRTRLKSIVQQNCNKSA